jgi:hypothetical protein
MTRVVKRLDTGALPQLKLAYHNWVESIVNIYPNIEVDFIFCIVV